MPSIHVVEVSSHTHPRPSTSVPIRGPKPRHVNIGGTSYIPSHIPSSSTLIPSNSFLTTHPPPNSSGPLGRSSNVSHVPSTSAHTIVSQGYVPPYVSTWHVPSYGPSYGPSCGPSHGPAYGTSYGPSYKPSYGQTYAPYGSRYQPVYQSPNYDFVAPQPQGTPNYNASMQPYMGQMGGGYYPLAKAMVYITIN